MKRILMKVSVYYFNCDHDIIGIVLISENGVTRMPHM